MFSFTDRVLQHAIVNYKCDLARASVYLSKPRLWQREWQRPLLYSKRGFASKLSPEPSHETEALRNTTRNIGIIAHIDAVGKF